MFTTWDCTSIFLTNMTLALVLRGRYDLSCNLFATLSFFNLPNFYRSRSLQKGQRSNQGHTMTLHTYTPDQCPYQVSTSYKLRFLRYTPDNIFKHKVTTASSKVKSKSHHDVAHLHPLTNVPTKYQLPTHYGF